MSETANEGLTVQDLLNVLKDSSNNTMSLGEMVLGLQEGWRQGRLHGHRRQLDTMLRAAIKLDHRFDQIKLPDLRLMDPAHVIGMEAPGRPSVIERNLSKDDIRRFQHLVKTAMQLVDVTASDTVHHLLTQLLENDKLMLASEFGKCHRLYEVSLGDVKSLELADDGQWMIACNK